MIKNFTEKAIRKSILTKINPKITSKGKHWKGSIYLGEVLIGKVKIPNEHIRIMKSSKSCYIASALRLDDSQFNGLIECPLSSSDYWEIQKKLEKKV